MTSRPGGTFGGMMISAARGDADHAPRNTARQRRMRDMDEALSFDE
jgi:hypothetical protein